MACCRSGTPYPSDWIKRDPLVPVLGFLGWTIPSNIPVSAFGGQSLFGLFTQQIGAELAHWPTGPSIDSPFWLYFVSPLCLVRMEVGSLRASVCVGVYCT